MRTAIDGLRPQGSSSKEQVHPQQTVSLAVLNMNQVEQLNCETEDLVQRYVDMVYKLMLEMLTPVIGTGWVATGVRNCALSL